MKPAYNVKSRVLAAFSQVLEPLVRILLRNGISFYDFAEMAKETYVRVCEREFAPPDREITKGRVAILTGLTRRDISRLLIASSAGSKRDLKDSSVARVLQGWHEDKDFLGPYGVPRDLAIGVDAKDGVSFVHLVSKYASDMSADAVLEEMLRGEAASMSDDRTRVRVTQRAYYIPSGFSAEAAQAEAAESFAKSVRRFVDTVVVNYFASGKADKRFERVVYKTDGIREEDWERFRSLVSDRMQPALEDLDSRLSLFETPESVGESGVLVGVGVYVFRESKD